MLEYAVENTRKESVTVDGLGVLLPGSTVEVDAVAAENFKFTRGLSLIQAGMPEGVQVIVRLTSEGVN